MRNQTLVGRVGHRRQGIQVGLRSWARGHLPPAPHQLCAAGHRAAQGWSGERSLSASWFQEPFKSPGTQHHRAMEGAGPAWQRDPADRQHPLQSGHPTPHHRNQSRPGPGEKPNAESERQDRSLLKRMWLGLTPGLALRFPLRLPVGPIAPLGPQPRPELRGLPAAKPPSASRSEPAHPAWMSVGAEKQTPECCLCFPPKSVAHR